MKQVDRHAKGQAFVDGLQAFNSFLDKRDVASIREIGSVLLNEPSIFKEEGVDSIFDLIDILIFQNGNLDVIFWQLINFDLLWEIDLVEQNNAVALF